MSTEIEKAVELAARIERYMLDAAQYQEGQIFDLYPDDQPTVIAALRAFVAVPHPDMERQGLKPMYVKRWRSIVYANPALTETIQAENAALPALKREESASHADAAVGREDIREAICQSVICNGVPSGTCTCCSGAADVVLALIAQAGVKREESENV